jgi:hypothetical protein
MTFEMAYLPLIAMASALLGSVGAGLCGLQPGSLPCSAGR